MKWLLRFFMTFNSTSWLLVIYVLNRKFTILNLPYYLCAFSLFALSVLFSALCLYAFKKCSKCPEKNNSDFKSMYLADSKYLPVYLGYFFVALSLDDIITCGSVYSIVFIFSFLSQTEYFNPIYLIFGYHYYSVQTSEELIYLLFTKEKSLTI